MCPPLLLGALTYSFLIFAAISTTGVAFPTKHDGSNKPTPTGAGVFVDEGGPTLRMPDINVPILYESDRVIAINKPHGIPHHDDIASGTPGILSLIRHLQQQSSPTGSEHSFPFKGRIFGVHRLDRATSGILLLAKDSTTAGGLAECFRERTVIKYYVAISTKKPKKGKQGWVKGDMVRGRRGAWMLKKTTKNPAVTRFFTAGLGSLAGDLVVSEKGQGRGQEDAVIPRTAILFRPHTGRTHQLRVAAKSLGLPIINDPYYGDGRATITGGEDATLSDEGAADALKRTYLHATALHLVLGEENVTIWCPPPFGALWGNSHVESRDAVGEAANRPFDGVVVSMMKKNCECEEILKLVDDFAQGADE